MSVLVKDMKIPKRCLDCPMYDCYNYYCKLYSFGIPARYNRDGSIRPEWCELVELPEKHGRLIDADELRRKMYHDAFETDTDFQMWNSGCWIRYKMFENNIDAQQTVIETECE